MPATLLIAGKDLRQRFRDRSALLVAFVLPLVLSGILGALWGPASTPRPFRYGVVDLDGAQLAGAFVTDVLQGVARGGVIDVRRVDSVEAAERLVDAGEIDAAFVLPAGFTARVRSQAGVDIGIVGSADAPTGTEVARAIARSYAAELTSVRVALAARAAPSDGGAKAHGDEGGAKAHGDEGGAKAHGDEGGAKAHGDDGAAPAHGDDADLARAAERVVATQRPLVLRDVSAAARILDLKTYLAAGLAVFFLFFTVQFAVASLLDERAQGTLARLQAAPVAPASILAGKLLAAVVVGMVSMGVLVTATTVLLGASWGDPVGVFLLVLAGVLAATGVTALVASVSRTPEQAGSWQAVVSVLLGLLGGSFFPMAQVGGVAGAASLLTPHAWFMRGLGDLHGGGVAAAMPAVGAICAFAAVTLGVALLRLRKVVQP